MNFNIPWRSKAKMLKKEDINQLIEMKNFHFNEKFEKNTTK